MGDYPPIIPSGQDTQAPLNVERRIRLIRRYVDLNDKCILDCGCGTGGYILEFMKYSQKVYGIECNEEKVRESSNLGIKPGMIKMGDIEHLEFTDNTFDLVLLNEVLEHISNEEKALSQIKRVLRPGGALVLFAPNRLYPFETHGVSLKRGALLPHYFPLVPYIPLVIGKRIFIYSARNYFPWELRWIIRQSGFIIIDQKFIWQTFENISGKSPAVLLKISPYLRKVSFLLEKIPFLNIFGVSQFIIAKKSG